MKQRLWIATVTYETGAISRYRLWSKTYETAADRISEIIGDDWYRIASIDLAELASETTRVQAAASSAIP